MTDNQNEYHEKRAEFTERKLLAEKRLGQIINEEYKKHETNFYVLTKREKEVLLHMALGCDSKEIAHELSISKHTVDTHRKNIYKKSQLKNLRDIVLFTLIFDMNL